MCGLHDSLGKSRCDATHINVCEWLEMWAEIQRSGTRLENTQQMLNKLTRVYPHTFELLMILELKAHSVAMGSVFTTDYNVNTVEIGCSILQSRF